MSRVQVRIPVVPVAHACRPRAGEPAGPPARCVVPAGSRPPYKLQGDSGRAAFPASAFPATLRLSTRNANAVAGLSGLRRSVARRPPALQRQRPTPSCGGSLGELLAGGKQAVEAAGGSEGVHRSSSPVGMLRSTVGVGAVALPTQLPPHQSRITRSCHSTEP